MSDYITRGDDTITPSVILGLDAAREGRNIVHPILGSANVDVTLRPASLRSGTLTLGFSGPTADVDSKAALDIHAGVGVLTLVAEPASLSMSYVVAGRIERRIEDETRNAWTVTVDFQEVSA